MSAATGRCRVLIAGFGVPAQRDLDFGRQVIRYLEPFTWPNGVVVEDLSYAAHLVLHRLHELEPSRLVLIGATARGVDAPGFVRLRRIDAASQASHEEAQDSVERALGGPADLDHTLAVLRQWGGLPPETLVIEVEAADCGFGTGFSEDLAACFDSVLQQLREALGDDGPSFPVTPDDFTAADASPLPPGSDSRPPGGDTPAGLVPLVDLARQRRAARDQERRPVAAPVAVARTLTDGNLVVAGRHRPWSIGIDGGSDWYDTIPLDHGATGVVIGSVPGRGAEAAGLKSDMRVAARAYAVIEGRFPSRLVACLDRMIECHGIGSLTQLGYLTVQPDTGEVRICSAGLCPPLLLAAGRGGHLLAQPSSSPLGASGAGHRVESSVSLHPGDTLLLYTDGLVRGRARSLSEGQAALLDAALCGPEPIDQLCDHIMGACLNRARREDDASLVAVRLLPQRS